MDMILGKCKFPNSFFSLFSVTYVVGAHWNVYLQHMSFQQMSFSSQAFYTNSQPLSLIQEISM